MMGRSKDVHPKANAALEAAGVSVEATTASIEAVRDVIRRKVPEAGAWARIMRSTQEAFWARVCSSYNLREDEFLRMLEASDGQGPGSVEWTPDYDYPDYAKVETHMQPHGFNGHPLSGLYYDYGGRVFLGKAGVNDGLHRSLAEKITPPKDGNVSRIMDIACAAGKLTAQLKRRFPDSEVWGSDISAPMVRYAHYRAIQENLDIRFIQKAGEDLDELPENHFDLVTAYILFHEVPLPVTIRTIKNVFRILRPGGTFVFFDFPTAGTGKMNYSGFLRAVDSADNSEPYAPEFVTSKIEERIKQAGFALRSEDPGDIALYGRVCDKPKT